MPMPAPVVWGGPGPLGQLAAAIGCTRCKPVGHGREGVVRGWLVVLLSTLRLSGARAGLGCAGAMVGAPSVAVVLVEVLVLSLRQAAWAACSLRGHHCCPLRLCLPSAPPVVSQGAGVNHIDTHTTHPTPRLLLEDMCPCCPPPRQSAAAGPQHCA
jgi:hypothetical protein